MQTLMAQIGLGPLPDNSKKLPLTRVNKKTGKTEKMGSALVGVEILPKPVAERLEAGFGRAEPNTNPVLDPPAGRIDWTQMWNPMYMIRTCIGKKMFVQLFCLLFTVGFIAASSYLIPPLYAFIQMALSIELFGVHIGLYLLYAVGICVCSCLTFLCCACGSKCCGSKAPEGDDDDDDDDDDDESPV